MRTAQEMAFLAFVRANAGMGFGAMMQIVSREYFRQYGDSAFVSGECVGSLPPEEKAQYEAGYRADTLFEGLEVGIMLPNMRRTLGSEAKKPTKGKPYDPTESSRY